MTREDAVKGLDFILRSDELEQLDGLSDKDTGEIVGALVSAFLTGESQEDRFRGRKGKKALLWNIYKGLDTAMLKRRKCALAGRDGGKARASNQAKRYQANIQAPLENATNLEARSKKLEVSNDDVVVLETLYKGTDPQGFPGFEAEAMREFNAATGKNYLTTTAKARKGMLDAFRAGRTIDDVRRVMADVAKWPPRMQTLDAVWADGRFEMHVNRQEWAEPVEYPGEATCPKCGEERAQIVPGMYRCDNCDITWRAS